MSAAIPLPQSNLTAADYQTFAESWITPELAQWAGIRRVSSVEGASVVGRKINGDYEGLVFPYRQPGNPNPVAERLRLDQPPMEWRDGKQRPAYRYVSAPGSRNRLYFAPNISVELLGDPTMPLVIVEGEKKALAVHRAAYENLADSVERVRHLAIGLAGVQAWRGQIGIVSKAKGERVPEKAPIPDLDLLVWKERLVTILFDSNVYSNRQVFYARLDLAKELQRRGANVSLADLPEEPGINGIDDFLARYGFTAGLDVTQSAKKFNPRDDLAEMDYTDAGNEEAFIILQGKDYRFGWTGQRWLYWNGVHWQPDQTGRADRAMLEVAQARLQATSTIEEQKARTAAYREARQLRNLRSRRAALESARSNPVVAKRVEDFDKDNHLFACGNGVVDLRPGAGFRPGRREDLVTKSTHVRWIPEASCERWLAFLRDIFPDRPDMWKFLKRAVGYSLTGLTRGGLFPSLRDWPEW